MKIARTLSAAVLVGVFVVSVAACSSPDTVDGKPGVKVSSSATATPTPSVSAVADGGDILENDILDGVKVGVPTDVKLTDVTTDSFTASWKAPNNVKGKINQYSVLVKENGEITDTFYTSETSYTVQGLTSNFAYMVEVRALATSEDGLKQATSVAATSNTVVISSPAPAPVVKPAPEVIPSAESTPEKEPQKEETDSKVEFSAPTEVKISDVTKDSFNVSWNAPAIVKGKINQYSVLVKENDEVTDTFYTSETSFSVKELSPNTSYLVEVRALGTSDDDLKQGGSEAGVSNKVVTSKSK